MKYLEFSLVKQSAHQVEIIFEQKACQEYNSPWHSPLAVRVYPESQLPTSQVGIPLISEHLEQFNGHAAHMRNRLNTFIASLKFFKYDAVVSVYISTLHKTKQITAPLCLDCKINNLNNNWWNDCYCRETPNQC